MTFSSTAKVIPLLLFFFSIAGCADHYMLLKKQSFDVAEQCLTTAQKQLSIQQQQQQQLLDQQQTMAATLTKLNTTLDHPLALSAGASKTLSQGSCTPNSTTLLLNKDNNMGKKQLVGSIEKIWLPELKWLDSGRIDTGAKTSSLNAHNIEPFERDGKNWVRFDVPKNKEGEASTVEHKIVRWVRIIQSSTDELQRRPVIRLRIMIGGISQFAEFNLVDRSDMTYPILIGRNVLKDLMLVDVSQQFAAPLQRSKK